jgi:toxin secretion/phage lysis holin
LDKIINVIKVAFAILGGTLEFALGGCDMLLSVLISLTVLDFISGVVLAVMNKELQSGAAYNGIAKKIGIYIIISMSVLVGYAIKTPELRGIIIGFYIAHEAISIVENCAALGLPIPQKIKDVLAQIKN